ncbi:TetR/AcrR family transcriptional regulator [Paenibacillus sp. FSL R5-0766]|uniref:TetR/AcrR family transcriptional regulator n=1 Tax=unclassified Paenibacillus TaxID=185978 RepID=UPI00096D3A67|nr:TetR/AcrR family transcriptional regulator [Paenibacillus sp. FSL R5-0765]OMF63604.1 TetR family transcriptional regulator [Paenibacillus sp. FSL R5-0765]
MRTIDRRQQVIDSAEKSFALFGYKATTMEQVARLANVGKGTIYTFFENKEELFDEILHSIITDMKQITEQTVKEENSFLDNVHLSMDSLLEYREEHELLIKLFQEVNDFGTPQAKEGLQKVETAILEYLERQVQRAMELQQIREDDPKLVSFVLLKLYVTLTSDWNKTHPTLHKDQIKTFVGLFLKSGL